MTKRRPEIPQRQMVDEVRITVDRWCGNPVCHHGRCIMARATLRQLARDNPHNFWSHKVIYNIGLERLTRVLTTVTGPLPEEAFARVRERLLSKSMRRSRSVSLGEIPNDADALVVARRYLEDERDRPRWVVQVGRGRPH